MNRKILFPLGALAAGLMCTVATKGGTTDAAFASPSALTATLTDHSNIDLRWKHNAAAPGGSWVEFSTPGDDFVKLDAVWPDTTTFHHPDVAPETKFIYRIRPFFGKPSKTVEIKTGHAAPPTEAEGPLDEPANTNTVNTAMKKSIRAASTFGNASPAKVAVSLSQSTSAVIRWEDRATDEDGYLVEVSVDPQKDFRICALLPPDTTSFRKVQLPPDMKCYFRVRAFFYGEPSNLASVSTPSAVPRAQAAAPQPEHHQ